MHGASHLKEWHEKVRRVSRRWALTPIVLSIVAFSVALQPLGQAGWQLHFVPLGKLLPME
ncbi:MAG: hypothetical protein IMHGJWDQ_001020 [Candidatus Fervidibacter sp.]